MNLYYVYRAYDAADRLLYIGCTNDLIRRRKQHAESAHWYPYAVRFVVRGPLSRDAAHALEHKQINVMIPAFGRTTAKASEHMQWNRSGGTKGAMYRPELDLHSYLALIGVAA